MSKYFRNFIDVQSTMPEEEQTATTQQITNTEHRMNGHQPPVQLAGNTGEVVTGYII